MQTQYTVHKPEVKNDILKFKDYVSLNFLAHLMTKPKRGGLNRYFPHNK